MMTLPYHYTESGLDNVYIHNLPVVKDVNGEVTFYIKKINLLHKVIAEDIVNKSGLINGKEIRFLRTEMGYTQSCFSELLGKEAQACGRWERGETNIDKTTDSLIRIVASNFLKLHTDINRISKLNSENNTGKKIDIDGKNYQYKPMVA